jgi:hypothetical protein
MQITEREMAAIEGLIDDAFTLPTVAEMRKMRTADLLQVTSALCSYKEELEKHCDIEEYAERYSEVKRLFVSALEIVAYLPRVH